MRPWDWTQFSRAIGERSTHWANEPEYYSGRNQ